MTYAASLPQKNYIPNVVILLRGEYFSIRQPDSGLTVDADKVGIVSSLAINPTSIDPFRATTAINSNSFKLLDRGGVITALFGSNPEIFQGNLCQIWVGRTYDNMPFSEYLQIPDTYISKAQRADGAYTFSTKESKDRINKDIYSEQNKLAVDILAATTTITLQSPPENTSGLIKIGDEFISYSGVSGNDLTGCIRGEENTIPADHELGDDVYFGEVVTGNPITILLKLLVSVGGGGTYDTLFDGAGIDENLIDVTQFEDIRDEYYASDSYSFVLFQITDLKKFIEDEILFPTGTRLRGNNNSKIGLAVLNHPTLNIDAPDLDDNQVTKRPSYAVDDTKITNKIKIEWNYDFGTGKFLSISSYEDAASLAEFGERKVLALKFKGVTTQLQVDEIAANFFLRFAFPRPVIDLNTHMSASAWLLGDKPYLTSEFIPTSYGNLYFGDNLEIINRAINHQTGDVKFQLMFTQFTGVRVCFLAPSDSISSVVSQSIVTVSAGRGDQYRVGWKMRLYDNTARDYLADAVNEITAISGDQITFLNAWSTTLVATQHRLSFADYNSVSEQQKKYCFISDDSNNFSDGKPPYQITY
jgi:hypothetical protein